MKALIFSEINQMALQDVEVPGIAADEVLIKMRSCGICHSDFELLSGKYIIPFSYPITPGHEWAGEVVKVGDKVTQYQVGDRVVGECVIGCGTCPTCNSGDFSYCPNANHFGFTINGADAEYFVARPEWLHKIPGNLSWKTAALIEPFCVAYYSLDIQGGVDASETVVVLGGGNIGLLTLAAAKGMGARTVLVEPTPFRQDIARQLGVDYVINPITENAVERVLELTGSEGADLVVEASGNSEALKSTFDLVKNSGKITFTGINIGQEIPIELGKIQIKGLQIRGVIGSPYVWDRAIRFLSQTKLDLSPIVTHQFSLSEAVEAFEVAHTEKNSIKIQILND